MPRIGLLGLHPQGTKGQFTDASAAGFDFLRFTVQMSRGLKAGKP
jgi:hypothetical protein